MYQAFQMKHLFDLHAWTSPKGKIYFADTYQEFTDVPISESNLQMSIESHVGHAVMN